MLQPPQLPCWALNASSTWGGHPAPGTERFTRMQLLGATVVPVTAGSRTSGCDQRGDARLGDECCPDALLRYRPLTPPSRNGPALPCGYRPGRANKPLEMTGRLLTPSPHVSVGAAMIGIFTRSGMTLGLVSTIQAGGEGIESGRHAAKLSVGSSRGCCTVHARISFRMTRGRRSPAHSISAALITRPVGTCVVAGYGQSDLRIGD